MLILLGCHLPSVYLTGDINILMQTAQNLLIFNFRVKAPIIKLK